MEWFFIFYNFYGNILLLYSIIRFGNLSKRAFAEMTCNLIPKKGMCIDQ